MHILLLAMTVSGTVTDANSHWTDDGSSIVTEATVHTADGDVVVNQLGGTVDGLTMRTFPGPEILAPGMTVDVAAHPDMDLSQRMHVVVDGVKVRDYPAGFVRTGPTKAGHYLFWESGCIFLTIDSAGTNEIAADKEFAVIDASIATWNDDTASCSYMKVMKAGTESVEVGKDYKNVLKFRDTSWCRPATGSDPQHCYSESAAGITTATYVDDASSPRDGAIVDADIEINGVNFAVSVNGQTTGTAPCHAELQNTLTHELGHLHGLEHTCLASGDPPRTDDQGNPVPSCSATIDPKILNATMYNFQDCGETKKETLDPDDINAICTIYPIAKDPHKCDPVTTPGGCCDAGGGNPAAALGLSGLIGVLALRRRRA